MPPDSLDAPKPPEIGIASIIRPVPRLLDSPTNANLPPLPLNVNTLVARIGRIVARTTGEHTCPTYADTARPTRPTESSAETNRSISWNLRVL